MTRIISILVENEAGILARVIGLFAQRGYNIDSLNVAPVIGNNLSRITLKTDCNEKRMEQIIKQLNKLINVIKVFETSDVAHIEQELVLIKLQIEANKTDRQEMLSLTQIFSATVVDISQDYISIQLAATCKKVDKFIHELSYYNIIEVARTGVIALTSNKRGLN